jgi:hypothetical protein
VSILTEINGEQMALKKFKGVILDLDGVITGTARVHGLAWESMFNHYLKMVAERDGTPFVPFDREKDYLDYVDGKPRMDGVKSFLESRGIFLPFGDYDDPPDKKLFVDWEIEKIRIFRKYFEGKDRMFLNPQLLLLKNVKSKELK